MNSKAIPAKKRKRLLVALGLAFVLFIFLWMDRCDRNSTPAIAQGESYQSFSVLSNTPISIEEENSYIIEALSKTHLRNLRMSFNGATLKIIDSQVLAGFAKPSRNPRIENGLVFQLIDPSGATLWTGSIRDPRITNYDSLDPSTQTLSGGSYKAPNVEFDIRIPHFETALKLAVYDFTSVGNGALIYTLELR